MKKIITLFLISAFLVLSGCSGMGNLPNVGNPADKQTQGQESKKNDSDSSSSQVVSSPKLPAVYETVVKDLITIVEFRISDSFESDYNNDIFPDVSGWLKDELENDDSEDGRLSYAWSNMLVEMPGYPTEMSMDSYGYILKDINGDGIFELFFVRKDHTVLAIFTADEDEADLVDAFWSRYKCVITDKDEIYTMGSSGAAYTDYSLKKLNFHEDDISVVKRFGNDDGYYETVSGKRKSIDETRFDELLREYPFENGNSWIDNAIVTF